jgi:hypothetical protein
MHCPQNPRLANQPPPPEPAAFAVLEGEVNSVPEPDNLDDSPHSSPADPSNDLVTPVQYGTIVEQNNPRVLLN